MTAASRDVKTSLFVETGPHWRYWPITQTVTSGFECSLVYGVFKWNIFWFHIYKGLPNDEIKGRLRIVNDEIINYLHEYRTVKRLVSKKKISAFGATLALMYRSLQCVIIVTMSAFVLEVVGQICC